MPRSIRLLAVSPLTLWLGGGLAVEAWIVAFNAEATSAAIGFISMAVAGGLYTIISKCGKPLVDLIGEYRKMVAATAPKVEQNAAEIEAIKDRTAAVEKLNSTLLVALAAARSDLNGLRQDAAGLGEAGLYAADYLKDPVKAKAEGDQS